MADLKLFNQTITNVKTQEYLKSVLGEKKQAFVNNLTALVSNDKALQACEPTTLMFAALKATALDLPLDNNLGFAYVIPYKNTRAGVTEAQFQCGYKGITQLAIRSGQFKTINVTDVRDGELKARNRMTGDVTIEWIDDDTIRAKAKVVGYLGYFKLLSGYEKTTYWSVEELEQHGVKYSQTYRKGYGVWKDNFDSMCRKTVVKLMLNKGDAPMSVEMQQAIKYDQSVILDENGAYRYVDNSKPTAEEKLVVIAAKEQKIEEAQVVEDSTDEQPAIGNEDVQPTE